MNRTRRAEDWHSTTLTSHYQHLTSDVILSNLLFKAIQSVPQGNKGLRNRKTKTFYTAGRNGVQVIQEFGYNSIALH